MAQQRECARHTILARPQAVFDAWTKPDLIAKWWGPEKFVTRVVRLDLSVGGRFAFEMTAPSGAKCLMTGVYRRIEPPRVLEFEVHDHCNLDLPHGIEPQRTPSNVTVRFSPVGDATLVTVLHRALDEKYAPLAAVGWSGALCKLASDL